MRRREFIAGLGGAAAVWPCAARAQSRTPMIGMMMTGNESDPQNQEDHAAFAEALAKLGWTDGRNVVIAYRWGGANDGRIREAVAELVGKAPDVIVARGTQTTAILKRQTISIPIVFVNVADPVASGFVASFAHPGGNITGFTSEEFSLAGKWLSLLKDIAPGIADVMVLYSPQNPNWTGYLRMIEAAASAMHVTIRAAPVAAAGEIASNIESFAPGPGAGMIVVPSGLTVARRSPASPHATICRRCIPTDSSQRAGGSPPTAPKPSISTGARPNTSTASCAAPNPATSRSRRRPSSSSSSISRPQRRSVLRFRRRCCCSPTR
jgi:putative tryptophan/tyrosine transport system substrate-binding protein